MTRIGKICMAALSAALLAGCTTDFYDSRMQGYTPEWPDQVYPIEVASGTVKLRVPLAAGSGLRGQHLQAVQRLGRAASSVSSPVVISRPTKSVRGEVLAAAITRELLRQGVARQRIVHRADGAAGEVLVSYRRKFAITRECGDWSEPITETAKNRPHRNYGCSQQHNIAAQVDNPEDFQRPRVMTPVDTDVRSTAMGKYRKGEDYTSQWPSAGKLKINENLSGMAKQ